VWVFVCVRGCVDECVCVGKLLCVYVYGCGCACVNMAVPFDGLSEYIHPKCRTCVPKCMRHIPEGSNTLFMLTHKLKQWQSWYTYCWSLSHLHARYNFCGSQFSLSLFLFNFTHYCCPKTVGLFCVRTCVITYKQKTLLVVHLRSGVSKLSHCWSTRSKIRDLIFTVAPCILTHWIFYSSNGNPGSNMTPAIVSFR